MSNPNNVAGGYKATISNPNTSEEAKERAAAKLEEMGAEVPTGTHQSKEHDNHVAGGHKATLSNPKTSKAAKDHSRDVLEDDVLEDDVMEDGDAEYIDDE